MSFIRDLVAAYSSFATQAIDRREYRSDSLPSRCWRRSAQAVHLDLYPAGRVRRNATTCWAWDNTVNFGDFCMRTLRRIRLGELFIQAIIAGCWVSDGPMLGRLDAQG